MKTRGYSLWLMPAGKVYHQLANLIVGLSKKYNGPEFPPHVTLLGGIEESEGDVLKKTGKLASRIKPYEIELTHLDYLDRYFQCVFVRVKETKPVLEANLKTRKVFNRETDPPYMPHLSLLYGNYPASIKKKVIQEVGREFKLSFTAASIHLISYTDLYDVKGWEKVREFKLKASRAHLLN